MNPEICRRLNSDLKNKLESDTHFFPLQQEHQLNKFLQVDKENYVFFSVLLKLWKGKSLTLFEINCLMPCKLFILRSIVLRKFQVELNITDPDMML